MTESNEHDSRPLTKPNTWSDFCDMNALQIESVIYLFGIVAAALFFAANAILDFWRH